VNGVVILNGAGNQLPFNSSSDLSNLSAEIRTEYRPLALRNERVGDVFRIQAAVLKYFREYLASQHFTEIVSSKIVGGGTEGGTNLFEIKYFDRVAYLAQSPQFYKEHGVAGLDRVFETGHVYRAEPHATSRHLTEYYSLDLKMGFIDGPEDVIELEQEQWLPKLWLELEVTAALHRTDFRAGGVDFHVSAVVQPPTWFHQPRRLPPRFVDIHITTMYKTSTYGHE
jgi:aspartyl/asparaginyl-tRNA synthetase